MRHMATGAMLPASDAAAGGTTGGLSEIRPRIDPAQCDGLWFDAS